MTPSLKKLTAVLLVGAALMWGVSARRHAGEVWVQAPPEDLDKINTPLPILSRAVRASPAAKLIGVNYVIMPDAEQPRQTLPRTLTWDRKTRVLRWQREFWFERYDGVTEETLHYVAERGGGVRMLIRRGCRRSFPRA